MARIRYFMTADGFRKSNNEAEEVLPRIGFVEAANIIGGLNFLRGSLEVIRRRNSRDLLGLRDGSEDYCLGVIGRKIDGRRTDRTISRRRRHFGP